MTVAEALRRFRKEKGLKQKDVAAALGMKPSSYAAYEAKENPSIPGSSIIIKLADTYDVTTDYLLGRCDTPKPNQIIDADAEQFYKTFQSMLVAAFNRPPSSHSLPN